MNSSGGGALNVFFFSIGREVKVNAYRFSCALVDNAFPVPGVAAGSLRTSTIASKSRLSVGSGVFAFDSYTHVHGALYTYGIGANNALFNCVV